MTYKGIGAFSPHFIAHMTCQLMSLFHTPQWQVCVWVGDDDRGVTTVLGSVGGVADALDGGASRLGVSVG